MIAEKVGYTSGQAPDSDVMLADSSTDNYVRFLRSYNNNNNNNVRNGSCFNVAGYLVEERRRWPVITASPRGQCSK